MLTDFFLLIILLELLIIPLFSIFIFCTKWLKRTAPLKYADIKHKYLFLKSKKIISKKKSLSIIPKLIFVLKLFALHNLSTTSNISPLDYYPNENFQISRFVQAEITC